MANAIASRPGPVTLAVNLLLISLLIGLLLALVAPDYLPGPPTHQRLDLFGRLLVMALTAGIIAMIWKGHKWARTTLFVILVFGGPMAAWYLVKSFPLDPLPATFGLVRLGFMITAIVLLCQKSSSEWFDRHGRPAVHL